MEFGYEPEAIRLEQVPAISTCRDSSDLLEPGRSLADRFAAVLSQIPYTLSWSQTGSKLVAGLLARASSLLAS